MADNSVFSGIAARAKGIYARFATSKLVQATQRPEVVGKDGMEAAATVVSLRLFSRDEFI